MKSTLLLPLALAALLLGPGRDSQGQAGPQRHAEAAGPLEGAPRPEFTPDRTAPRMPAEPPPAWPHDTATAPGRAWAAMPQGSAPSSLPASTPAERMPSLPIVAPDGQDWRDSALDLLSQIGVLCPASGCDSLEDD